MCGCWKREWSPSCSGFFVHIPQVWLCPRPYLEVSLAPAQVFTKEIIIADAYATNRDLGILVGMMAAFCLVHLLAAEFVPARASRGERLLFKRRVPGKTLPKSQDEESGGPSDAHRINRTNETRTSPEDIAHEARGPAAVMSWENISYEVKTRKGTRTILKNIDGCIKPGTLTALMVILHQDQTILWHRANYGSRGSRAPERRLCSTFWPAEARSDS